MSQRDRPTSRGVPEAGQATPLATGTVPTWEDLYQGASPAQRGELLALADRQGLLYAHQLPAPASANGLAREPQRQLLNHLLAGHTGGLEPLHAPPAEVEDGTLDAVQREAVAKALATPDICLIQGLPGTGKTRLLAEVITRAAARGERVLLLAPTPAALDHALGLIAGREVVFAIRCLGRDESPESLAPSVRSLTFAERVRWLKEHTRANVLQDIQAAEERCARLHRAEALWPRLEELADRQQQVSRQLDQIQVRRAAVAETVEQEARQAESPRPDGPPAGDPAFHAAIAALHGRLRESMDQAEKDRAVLVARVAEGEKERNARAAAIDRLGPVVKARQAGRWWSPVWWRVGWRVDVQARLAEQETLHRQAQEALEQLKAAVQRLETEQEQTRQSIEIERARLIEAAGARRRAELDDQEAALRQESGLVQEKWQAACRELGPEGEAPAAMTREALQAAHDAWRQQVEASEERGAFARQWATYLEESGDTLVRRTRDLANVVAATPSALAGDANFGEAAAPPVGFDLLVLEGADQLTEPEFLNAARRARRWVLTGEPALHPPKVEGRGFFHRLWEHLHFDPRRLPYDWVQEKKGLCCRLRPLTPEQRQWLQCEPVADSPDIELRIFAPPRTPPTLAEVAFPARMSIAQAKEYIFRELAELAVRADRHSLRWVEGAEHLVLSLADTPANGAVPVALGPGVRELVAARKAEVNGGEHRPAGWHTCSVEFDRRAGWHRQRAEEWVQQHLGVRDPGRTIRLDVPYRMHPDLAALLSDWLFAGAYDLPPAAPELTGLLPGNGTPAVQFVPVPSLANDQRQRRRGEPAGRAGDGRRGTSPTAPRVARAGAGLELDAADPRHRDRLPAELRSGFTGRGFINCTEAQAVVRALEALVADPALRAAAQSNGDPHRTAIGVMALYPAQAELIRRLMARVPSLAAPAVSVKVDVPAAFREGECLVGLLSLTRSHSHRAVSFGEGPQLLVRALTRARARLVLFGDPGTLARRSQWHAPLDHLDDPSSAWEHQVVSQLVGYLHGQGAPPHRFQLCEGSAP